MVTASQLISYAAVSAVLIAVPGPSVLFAVGRTLSRGRRVAIASVIGNALGSYAVALLVWIGLGALVTKSDALLEILKLGGGAYLIALGVSAFRHRRSLG